MKKTNLKSMMSLVVMTMLLTAFAPNFIFAQKNNKRIKNKRINVETPVKHYHKQPRRGAQITVLPRKTTIIKHRNLNYHYRDGIFYRPINGRYVVAVPPIGMRVQMLPPNPLRLRLLGSSYFYYYGTYYAPLRAGGYEIVAAPIGATVDALPDGYDVFELEGNVYYRIDETYYKAIYASNGNIVYKVVRV